MKQQLFIALVLFVMSFASSTLYAGGTTYQSTGSGGNWTTPTTWTPNGVPADYDDVTISFGTTVTIDGNLYCNNLIVDGPLQFDNVDTRSLVVNGNLSVTGMGTIRASAPFATGDLYQTLWVKGNLTVNGTFTATVSGSTSGTRTITLRMHGSSDQAIGGSGPLTIPYLYSNGATTIKLNVAINGCIDLGLQTGNLDNSTSNITMTGTGFLYRYAAAATMSVAPVWAGHTQVAYYNSAPLTSGIELPSSVYYLMMEGPGGVTLDKPITVTNYLVMDNGIVTSSSTNLVTIGSSVSIWSTSSSFVSGPVACVNAAAGAFSKTYPIGKGSIYRPLTLSLNQTAVTSSTYKAEMFNSAPPANALPEDASLDKVSSVRYYTVEEAGGGSAFTAGSVTLSYDVDDAVTSAAALRIVKNDGSGNWGNLAGAGTANTTGTITSTIPFGNITSPRTVFTLANAKGGGNPLLVEAAPIVPKVFALEQNYPNPFNPTTKISYQIPVTSRASLTVFDLLGREVVTLFNEIKPAGSYTATFDGTNLPSGVYFYRLKTESFAETKRLLLLK